MGSSKSFAAAAGILAIAASVSAQAADLLPPPPLPEPIVDIGGAWYLRGDVGVGIVNHRRSIGIDASVPPVPYTYTVNQDRVSDQVFIGGGVGYQFNSWLRVDATGEYRTKSDWRFIAEDTSFGGTGGYDLVTGKWSSAVGLINVYFDLGHWYGLSPFVGAGVGVAHHMFESITDQGLGAYVGGFGVGPSHDKTNLAWAIHAGVGYDVTPNLKLELAYRYLNMGDAETGSVACLPTCNLRTIYRVKELDAHEIKIGMRWLLGGPLPVPEPLPEPMPLIRKY